MILDGVVSKARVFNLRVTYRFGFPGQGGKRGHQSTTPLSVLTATPISPGEVVQTAAKLTSDLLVDMRAMSAATEGAVP